MNTPYRPNIDAFKEKNNQQCKKCRMPIMPAVASYSIRFFGMPLCRDDQKKQKRMGK